MTSRLCWHNSTEITEAGSHADNLDVKAFLRDRLPVSFRRLQPTFDSLLDVAQGLGFGASLADAAGQ